MRETYSTIRHLLHLATELDRACALFLSTHVSITHDEARVLLELGLTYLGARTAKETEQTLDRFFDGLGKHLGYDDLDGLLNTFQDATDYLSSCCPSCETPS